MKIYRHSNGRLFRQSSVYSINDAWYCLVKWIDTGKFEKFYYDEIAPYLAGAEPKPAVKKEKTEPKPKKAVIKNDSKLQQKLL